MSTGDLSFARRKLYWAERHLELLNAEVRSFIEGYGDPFEVNFDPTDETRVFTMRERKPIPTRWGLIFGDFVSNARSSLDHLVWQLVLSNGATPGRHNSFPVFETERGWSGNVESRPASRGPGPLDGISSTAWTKVKALQPYHAGDRAQARAFWLGALHYLWNVDKHQVVHSSMAYATGGTPTVTVSPPECVRVGSIQFGRQVLVDGAEVARVQVQEITPPGEREVKMDFDCPLSVAFGEEGKGVASMGFLDHIVKKLHESVAGFEDEFS